jgi:hypothetical protein
VDVSKKSTPKPHPKDDEYSIVVFNTIPPVIEIIANRRNTTVKRLPLFIPKPPVSMIIR